MKTLRQAFTDKYPKYGKLIDDYEQANSLRNADWDDITKLGLSNFVDFLQENNAQSSARTYCAMLKSVLNTYCDEVNLPKDFMKILSVKGCISESIWLNDAEIESIIQYEPKTPTERLVRNQFVLEAKYLQCWRDSEIAEVLGIKKNTVRTRLFRAKNKVLEIILRGNNEEE